MSKIPAKCPVAYLAAAIAALASLSSPEPAVAGTRSFCVDAKECTKECQEWEKPAACARLAHMHRRGIELVPDRKRAWQLYRSTCDKGYAEACVQYADMARQGWMFEVPQSEAVYAEYIARAGELAASDCEIKDADACFTLAELRYRDFRTSDWPGSARGKVASMLDPASLACSRGHGAACHWLEIRATELLGVKLIDGKAAARAKKTARSQYRKSCDDGDNVGCLWAAESEKDIHERIALYDVACNRGDPDACMKTATWMWLHSFRLAMEKKQGKKYDYLAKATQSCQGRGHETCHEYAERRLEGRGGYEKDLADGMAILMRTCRGGQASSCKMAGDTFTSGKYGVEKNRERAIEAYERLCLLSAPSQVCRVCSIAPETGECQVREAWRQRSLCEQGHQASCERLGTMYRDGAGVAKSPVDAASHYRRSCDYGRKSECPLLDELCGKTAALKNDEACRPSLIQSDLFFEAEWQFRHTGSARIVAESDGESGATEPVQIAPQPSSDVGAGFKRGSLDADLVVSIVLDRARLAAIRLVVNELRRVGRRPTVPGYLRDLLTQGALLLADHNTLRREKFRDLTMTVVRAFVAANLVDTLYPTDDALLADIPWARWAAKDRVTWKANLFTAEDQSDLRVYLTDWAYYLLGETKIFSRGVGDAGSEPACWFRGDRKRVLCRLLSGRTGPDRGRLAVALRVAGVLQALAVARSLRDQGAIDLRRFIAAITKAKSIANLKATPGLNLEAWKADIVETSQARLRELTARLDALVDLTSPWLYSAEIGWGQVDDRSETASELLAGDSPQRSSFGAGNLRRLKSLFADIAAISAKVREATPATRAAVENEGKKQVLETIRSWRKLADLTGEIETLKRSMRELRPALARLKLSIGEIETVMSQFTSVRVSGVAGTEVSFALRDVPLHALPELASHFRDVVDQLQHIETHMRRLFPRLARSKLRFASSAVVRTLGLLDLMQRLARTARLGQTCGEIIDALKLLGSRRGKEFAAPLFDLMDPVLHAIHSHEPLGAELLFAVVSRVRLDSLVTSLAAKARNPCGDNEAGFECWTVKIVHALQEAIQRDGGLIRVDGGKFAERLAAHGDDFRRRNSWRGYFHLTVGFGGLYSPPPATESDASPDSRFVPLVSEQIGFGWASPTFYGDTFSFKAGVFGSGILYRAVLDSAESNAIIVSPFVALDVFDLVELYVAPTLLVYPPTDSEDTDIGFGAAAGLTIPLGAYLERLSP